MEHFISPLTVDFQSNSENFKADTDIPSLELGLTPMVFVGNNPNKFFTNLLISFDSSTEAKNITHEDSADEIIAKRKQKPAEFPCLQHPDLPNFTIVSPQLFPNGFTRSSFNFSTFS